MRAAAIMWVLLLSGCFVAVPSAHAQRREAHAHAARTRREGPRDRERTPRLDPTAIRGLDAAACHGWLRRAHVAFDVVDEDVDGVAIPVRITAPIGGIEVGPHHRRDRASVMDCRLALAILAWGPSLRRAGVTRIEHYSVYRPHSRVGGSGRRSGHAVGLAIDAARFRFEDGRELNVLEDWALRERGGDPCADHDDDDDGRTLRALVCNARSIFQTIITPHHNAAHRDHVHLELVPDVDWTYVH